MKMYLISDNIDTCTGMRLAGIEGVVVHEREELITALDKVLADESVGIIILTVKLSSLAQDYINEIKLTRSLPLVVEIPDRHGLGKPENYITDYVREAVGLKL